MNDPKSAPESQRLKAVALYRTVDEAVSKTLNDLTRLAAAICETPISLITILEADQQIFMARQGIEGQGTLRRDAFCNHALSIDDLLIVEDAQNDQRFQQNPYVIGDPHIRFYAGAPLTVEDGATLGTLCVIDSEPRTLTDHQQEALRILRNMAVDQLKLARARDDLRALKSLLPMCAWCRSIQTEDGSWQPLHEYVVEQQHVSHGICPVCSHDLTDSSD
jgi:GAF domain-containing protein